MTTQKDIARELGVSVALVSRALSGTATNIGVPDSTVQRIRQAAERMGYVPNVTARILQGAPSATLGVVVSSFEDPFLGPIIGILQQLAREHCYSLVLEGLDGVEKIPALVKHRIMGLIIAGSCEDLDWLEPFTQQPLPIACIGHTPAHPQVRNVTVDERRGIALLLQHVKTLGHRNIGFVGGTNTVHRKREAYFAELVQEDESLHTQPDWITRGEGHFLKAGHQAMTRLLDIPRRSGPTAVLASSDVRALGAMRACRDRGHAIPESMSLTGFDDIPLAPLLVPSLTTVRQPIADMTRLAFNHATRDDVLNPGSMVLQPELVIRESTAAL